MRRKQIVFCFALTFVFIISCARKEENKMEVEADHLYHESVQLVRTYTDSMNIARDSATVNRLDKSFDNEMTRLNYKYSPEAYLGISQGQNDTLTRLTMRFVELRDSLLHRIAHPIVCVTTDSISADTLTVSATSASTP